MITHKKVRLERGFSSRQTKFQEQNLSENKNKYISKSVNHVTLLLRGSRRNFKCYFEKLMHKEVWGKVQANESWYYRISLRPFIEYNAICCDTRSTELVQTLDGIQKILLRITVNVHQWNASKGPQIS